MSYGAGAVGWFFIGPDVDTWYADLIKPALTPPASVFIPVLFVLYALMGIALGLVWSKTELWHAWIGCFAVSLAFNAAWMMFFFGFHAIFIALSDIVCLLIILLALVLGAWEIDRRAAYLLLPYLAFIVFAAYLNIGIWLLN